MPGADGPASRRRVPARAAAVVALALAAVGFAAARAFPTRGELAAWSASGRPPDLSALDAPLEAAAAEAGVDPALLRALVAAESSGRPRARSAAGAVGLTQLMPATAAEVARAAGLDPASIDLEDPATNLRLGARYLRRMLDLFGGEEAFAVAAYNAGPEPVKRWRLRAVDAPALEVVRREGYAETRAHVERTLRWRAAYRGA